MNEDTVPTVAEALPMLRRIVERHQYEEWPEDCKPGTGLVIDAFTAAAITHVHDALNDANRERFEGFPLTRASGFAFKLIRKAQK